MNGSLSVLVGEGDEHNEQHERCGNEPVGVSCIINVLEVDLSWLIDLINELGVKVSRDDGDARFEIHDVAYRWTRGTKSFDKGDGSRSKKKDIGQVKGQSDQTG
jgi:hypothetical protein